MKKYSIDEVCKELGISRQGLNSRCRKLGIEKIKEGRRSYFTYQHLKLLRGKVTPEEPKNDSPDGISEDSNSQQLVDRLINENEYLRKKLDNESDNLKGAMSIILQHTERIKKLEMENDKLLEYKASEDIMENDGETEWKQKPQQKVKKWYQKLGLGINKKE